MSTRYFCDRCGARLNRVADVDENSITHSRMVVGILYRFPYDNFLMRLLKHRNQVNTGTIDICKQCFKEFEDSMLEWWQC